MSDKANTFLVSDESINRYGYRVLTGGIDMKQFKKNPLMYYLHDRFTYGEAKPRVTVIGRWENIRKEGDKLYADAVFDEADDFAKQIKGKVDRGFLKMASISVNPLEKSEDKKYLVAGQTRPTVTKSELIEISIVDRGGNNNALKLCNSFGELRNVDEELPLLELSTNINNNNMSDFKTIATALKLDANASESEILKAIGNLQTAEVQLADLKKTQEAAQEKEAIKLVDKAIEKGIIPQALKDSQVKLFADDFTGQKEAFEALLSDKDNDTLDTSRNQQLADFTKGIKGGKSGGVETESYDYLQKHNPEKLKQLKADDPKTYNELVADYVKGVRHNNNSKNQ
jgi:negative regulator of replication initiation